MSKLISCKKAECLMEMSVIYYANWYTCNQKERDERFPRVFLKEYDYYTVSAYKRELDDVYHYSVYRIK